MIHLLAGIAALGIIGLLAALVGWWLVNEIREYLADSRDRTPDAGLSILDGEVIGVVADEPTRPLPAVARSPLAGPRHMADGEAKDIRHVGRHRDDGRREPWMNALLTPTQTFNAIVEQETGAPPAGRGPTEANLPMVRTERPASQPALFEAVTG